MAVGDYGDAGQRKLDRLRQELGLDYRDPNAPSRESRTRSELLGYEEPYVRDVSAPEDQDMWSEEEVGGDEELAEAEPLGVPEYIDEVIQSLVRGRPTKRPDKYVEYYSSNNPKKNQYQSTRVHAMQWIPTIGYSVGDILVAFARPSNSQAHALYVYENNTRDDWDTFKNGTSLGKYIRSLKGGRMYADSDGLRYKKLHENTMDGGYPYDFWIFNEMERWSTIRPNNEKI